MPTREEVKLASAAVLKARVCQMDKSENMIVRKVDFGPDGTSVVSTSFFDYGERTSSTGPWSTGAGQGASKDGVMLMPVRELVHTGLHASRTAAPAASLSEEVIYTDRGLVTTVLFAAKDGSRVEAQYGYNDGAWIHEAERAPDWVHLSPAQGANAAHWRLLVTYHSFSNKVKEAVYRERPRGTLFVSRFRYGNGVTPTIITHVVAESSGRGKKEGVNYDRAALRDRKSVV